VLLSANRNRCFCVVSVVDFVRAFTELNAKFVLIGSGLAGGLLAAYLGRRGYEVDLYERRGDPREGKMLEGRSINLALSTRGIHALQQIGLADEVLQHAIPMRGRMIHEKSGALHFAPYDVDPNKHINSIGRAALNMTVIEAAQRSPNVRVHFSHKCAWNRPMEP
jgi:kynurenine 3-monooxygenase